MHRLDKPLRCDYEAHMALCATYATRQAHAANVSRVLTRHASQRVTTRQRTSGFAYPAGFAPIVGLSLALIIGVLLSFGV